MAKTTGGGTPGSPEPDGTRSFRLSTTQPVLLARTAHPRQALLTSAALAMAAAVAGRPLREVGLVALTVLVGQAVLGWWDDLSDRVRDARQVPERKPVAAGLLDPGTLWFAIVCAVLLVVPLSMAHGVRAGGAYLASLLVAAAGDRLLHARPLSFLPWMVSFALYPAFLSYGGWGGGGTDIPPEPAMVVLAALLGLGVHLLLALPGLVRDHEEGERSLPMLLALRIGTPRLLVTAGTLTTLVLAAMLIVGRTVGLA